MTQPTGPSTTTEGGTADPAETTEAAEVDTDDGTGTEVDGQDDTEAADDARDDNAIGREAARYRVKLREAKATLATLEAAHAATTETLTQQRQAIVDTTLASVGLDARLLAAAGHTVDDFVGENGLVDGAKLAEATKAAVAEFGVRPRKLPAPNGQQGQPGGAAGGTTWGKVLGDVARR